MPAWVVMVMVSRSSSMRRFIFSSDRRMPPKTGMAPPARPEPAPRGVMGTCSALARRTTAATCKVVVGRTTASGMRAYSLVLVSSWA